MRSDEAVRTTVRVRAGEDAFHGLHHDPRALADDVRWFELLERHVVGAGEGVRLACAFDGDGRPGARRVALPCVVRRTGPFGSTALASLSNYYLPDWRPLATDHDAADLVGAALGAALEGTGAAVARFEGLAPDAPELAALGDALRRLGWRVRTEPGPVNWTESIEDGHDAWLARRPGRLRSTLSRRGRRFASTPGARLELGDGDTPDLGRLIDAWRTVYARSWKSAEAYPDFVPDLVRMLAARGSLRLGVAWLADVPIATQLWVVRRGVAFVYKLAYDEAAARYSAGSLLFAAMARQAMERDGVRRLDFLSGDDAYKADWTSDRTAKVTLLGFDPRTAAGLAGLARFELAGVRDAIRGGGRARSGGG